MTQADARRRTPRVGQIAFARGSHGKGRGCILEVVRTFDGNTFRSVYTVRFAKAVYVLHGLQKKSPSGIRTSVADLLRADGYAGSQIKSSKR
jgi:hypothetical protein